MLAGSTVGMRGSAVPAAAAAATSGARSTGAAASGFGVSALGAGMQFVGADVGLALMLAGFWHPAAIFLPMFVMGAGQGMALPNVTASAVALARNSAGAASSMLGFSQQMVGALSVQAMALLPATTPVPVYVFCAATAALAFGAVLVLPDAEKAR